MTFGRKPGGKNSSASCSLLLGYPLGVKKVPLGLDCQGQDTMEPRETKKVYSSIAFSVAGLCIAALVKYHRRRLKAKNNCRQKCTAGRSRDKLRNAPSPCPRDVWLDVDTGVDDALAILLAVRSRQLRVVGISCVVGNHTIDKVCAATLKVLDAACAPAHLPVGRGCCAPLIEPPHPCPQIHGDDCKLAHDTDFVCCV